MQRTGAITLAVILGVIVLIAGFFFSTQSNLNRLDQDVKEALSNVETDYQRRMDLIPNMVEVVKKYAKHERQVFQDIANARSNYAGSTSGSPARMRAINQLDNSFSRLMAVVENYPNLKANEQYNRLMDQWEGTENRIKVARMRYNEVVKNYNYTAKTLTGRFWVNMFGFDKEKDYFAATPGADKAPSAKDLLKD